MCSQTKNSCAKAFDNQLRSNNLKPKKSRGRGGGSICPLPLKASMVNTPFPTRHAILVSTDQSAKYIPNSDQLGKMHTLRPFQTNQARCVSVFLTTCVSSIIRTSIIRTPLLGHYLFIPNRYSINHSELKCGFIISSGLNVFTFKTR